MFMLEARVVTGRAGFVGVLMLEARVVAGRAGFVGVLMLEARVVAGGAGFVGVASGTYHWALNGRMDGEDVDSSSRVGRESGGRGTKGIEDGTDASRGTCA